MSSIGHRISTMYRSGSFTQATRFADAAGGEIRSTMDKILALEDEVADIAEAYERASLRDDDEGEETVESLAAKRTEAKLAITGLLAFMATL